ncbi:MAG TPA: phosphotransferase [Isosphaeraceae bacterium]|jgi:5-methylthioribose kinase|nr:phosphotransferase [Isosphaeraceae bacterium]
MREITPENAAQYLREIGRVPPGREVQVYALGGGVSNVVMRVDVEGQPPLVLKQSRERLRTEMLWLSRLERIWTERAALELLGTILPRGTVPEIVFSDEDNFLFGMTCAPEGSGVWKEQLLAVQTDPEIAHQAGTILGTIHAETIDHPGLGGRLGDTVIFDQLRIDPYYRTIARAHPALAPQIDTLIATMAAPDARTLVLADFSPKNILVHEGGVFLVDFETAHAGDPAFDLGFFLSHLLLKAFRAAPEEHLYLSLTQIFWQAYLERTKLHPGSSRIPRAIQHTAACCLARVDGKSPVDYLDKPTQKAVRHFAICVLARNGATRQRAGYLIKQYGIDETKAVPLASRLTSEVSRWDSLLALAVQEMRHKS